MPSSTTSPFAVRGNGPGARRLLLRLRIPSNPLRSLCSFEIARAFCNIRIGDSPSSRNLPLAAGFFQEEIARSAYAQQLRVEAGETVVVGVNRFADDADPPSIPTPDFSALEREQVGRVRSVRAGRDASRAEGALAAIRAAASPYANPNASGRPALMPLIVEAVRARATVGEISDTLRSSWGEYRPT